MQTLNYKISHLSNGIRVVTETIPHVRSVSLGVWIGAGSRYEDAKNSGISHFIEHMLFKGTKNRSAKEIAESLDAVGGQINAFTSKEYTCYYAKVLDENINLAIDVLADMLFNSLFEEHEIEKEKGVIIEELKMYEDTPDELIHDLFAQNIWPDHPLGRPILGTEETITGFNREDFISYMKEHYRTDNMVISLTGRLDHDKVINELERLFGTLEKSISEQCLSTPTYMPSVNYIYKETGQVQICIGAPGYSNNSEAIYPISILNIILGGGISSRLVQEIREERGLAYSVYSYHGSFSDCGVFTFYAGTRPENYQLVIELILRELTKIVENGITDEELEKAKHQLKGSLYFGLESVSSRMNKLGRSLLCYNKITTPEETYEKITNVTCEEIQMLAKSMFISDQYTISILGPVKDVPTLEDFLNRI